VPRAACKNHVVRAIRVSDIHDERLTPFLRVADADLRRREGVFLAEGRLVVRRLLDDARYDVRAVLVTESALAALEKGACARPDVPCYVVPLAWMELLTGFNLHRGCLAVAARPPALDWRTLSGCQRLLVLEGIGNPDNVGGLVRTAHALGADGLLLGPGTGDPLYRKALRVSCGAALAMPFAAVESMADALEAVIADGAEVWALTPAGETTLDDACRERLDRLALVVGAEGPGLTPGTLARASRRVRIPVRDGADSLNVVVAAAIALAAAATRR
jgi:tRNA G18 (ribose-2'-O)-methylase SpoU